MRKMHTLNGEVTSFVALLAQAKACHATTSMTVNLGSLILSHRTPQATEHIDGLPPVRVFALSRAFCCGRGRNYGHMYRLMYLIQSS